MKQQRGFLPIAAAIAAALAFGTGPVRAQGGSGIGGQGLGGVNAGDPGMGGPMNSLWNAPASGRTDPWSGSYGGYNSYGFRLYSGLYGYPTNTYWWGYPYDEPPRYSLGRALPSSVVQQPDNRARIRLEVPAANAEVWFDGEKTSQIGLIRDFYSPPLTPGKSYTYHVQVRWLDNGKPVEQERAIHVQANTRQEVNFGKTAAAEERKP
jgi:uncharacterized protein (TIGR03000 family)